MLQYFVIGSMQEPGRTKNSASKDGWEIYLRTRWKSLRMFDTTFRLRILVVLLQALGQ
jgi:hypothetical protein